MEKTKHAVMKAPSVFDAIVDIIVPYHGQYDKVMNLVESIFRLTRSNYYQLIVVDDFSPNEHYSRIIADVARKREIPNLSIFRTEYQMGFGGACLEGFKRAEHDYVCFLHSDVEIQEVNWLRRLGECLLNLQKSHVAMVSPKTNNPVNGDPLQEGEKEKPGEDEIIPEGSFLSTYCLLSRRDLFDRCGGFFKDYPFGFYEDEEFAYRMGKHGLRQAVAGKSWVFHHGAATIGSLWKKNPGLKRIMEVDNRKRCIADMKSSKG